MTNNAPDIFNKFIFIKLILYLSEVNFRVIFITIFLSLNFLFSKTNKELEQKPFIKTVIFSGGSFNSQFPIINMNQKLLLLKKLWVN